MHIFAQCEVKGHYISLFTKTVSGQVTNTVSVIYIQLCFYDLMISIPAGRRISEVRRPVVIFR